MLELLEQKYDEMIKNREYLRAELLKADCKIEIIAELIAEAEAATATRACMEGEEAEEESEYTEEETEGVELN